MSSPDVEMRVSDEAERQRKADKKAKKAAKRAREAEEAEQSSKKSKAAEEPQSSPVAVADLTDEEEARRKEEKKKRKAEKKAKKEGESSTPASSPASSAPGANFEWKGSAGGEAASPLTAQRKNFYKQHAAVAAMSDADVAKIRAEHKMTLSGNMYGKDRSYHPVQRFDQAGYSKELLKCTQGFSAPTGIQAQCWPVLLSGRDAIAIAETGSGKTLGFILPALVHVLDARPIDSAKKGRNVTNMGPIVLILAPTRELAMQSAEVAENAAQHVNLRTACIYGGVDRQAQRVALNKGVHVMVATPGRLESLIRDGEVSLSRVTFLVLDEADRMLDLGFEPSIRALVSECPDSQQRQTLMFSATWPEAVKKLASSFIVDPLRITIGKDPEEMATDTLAANKRIKQSVEVLEDDWKKDARLGQIMAEHTKGAAPGQHKKILVFVLYKKEVDRVERSLRQKGFQAVGMSSDKTQAERVQALEHFKSGKVRLLVATDVAGRGLDINDIALVVNYTFPLTIEDYVHRIGRTGRGGKSGESITFFTKSEKHLSGELINVLREANQDVPEDLMKFGTGVKRKAHGMYGLHYKAQDDDRPMKQAVKVTFD